MESSNEDKTITSLKVWRQSQKKLKILAALQGKTMQEALDIMLTRTLAEEDQKRQGEKK